MLDFMVIGLPRSGTTWAANWLTTNDSHCYHDPLYRTHYSEWDLRLANPLHDHQVGVACTGIWRWTAWVNAHPARKLVLLRNEDEVNRSLRSIGLPEVEPGSARVLQRIDGLHVPHSWLFNEETARQVWHYLLEGVPFNGLRHRELLDIEMQPKFNGLSVGVDVTRRLVAELDRITQPQHDFDN